MKRFVSYLYSIYNNQKIHNSGFARIELRAGRNRIDIHLQESGYSGKTGTVYLFVRKKENIQGISIGNILFQNNQADFRYEQPEENIGQTPWQIMQMNGIVVLIDNKITFLSQWDEQPVDTTRFEVWSGEKEEKQQESTITNVQEVQNDQPVLHTDADDESKHSEQASDEAHISHEDQAITDTMQIEHKDQDRSNALPVQNIQEAVNEWQGKEKTAEERQDHPANYSNIQTAEIQPQPGNVYQWEQTWRYMLRVYPVLNQFGDKDNVLCVRIEIKDVRLLPEKYWSVINNSFLLHGFFNYRYLIFGRIGQNWMIGIPGIYQNQEHAMASIFGFPDFLPQSEKNERGEQPGYWYRILEI